MKKILISLILLSSFVLGQVSIAVGNPPLDITFSSFIGSGFAPTPSSGQLDSDEWRINGLSYEPMNFGDIKTNDDFARGIDGDGVGTGGIYAFNVGASNYTLGTQPGGSDMTPGNFTLRLVNNGIFPITNLTISYKIYYYNDQDRANSFNFAYSVDDITYTLMSSADFTSPEIKDVNLSWQSVSRTVIISGISIDQNNYIYLQWQTDDVSGGGSRDEFALDDISFDNILPVELTTFSVSFVDNNVELNWETATEVNNYGFEIERKQETLDWRKIGFINGYGNSNSPKYYSFTDNTIENSGKYFFRLKQVDTDGTFEFSDVIEINLGIPGKFQLNQNYPNPFNPTTTIRFSIPTDSHIKLSIFNVLGEEVAELINGNTAAGYHSVKFDAKNLNSGIYFYKLEAENFVQIRKMMLIK